MKKLAALPCCMMLAAALLTGCMPVGIYETEHFRFSVSPDWHLEQAEYNKETQKSEYLRFECKENRDGCWIRDYQTDESAQEIAASMGDEEPMTELTGCKYPAWKTVHYDRTSKDSTDVMYINVYVEAEGHILYIHANHPHGMLPMHPEHFEETLSVLLESLTLTGDTTQSEGMQ